MERADWEILDVEGLRLHYARTCRHWVERLQARADEARALVGERIYRTWLLYLACSAVSFEDGSIGLYQTLVRKHRDATGGFAPRHARGHLPARRRVSFTDRTADARQSAAPVQSARPCGPSVRVRRFPMPAARIRAAGIVFSNARSPGVS